MKRESPLLWIYLLGALSAVPAAAAVSSAAVAERIYLVAAVAVLPAVFVAIRRFGLERSVAIVALAIGAFFGVSQLVADTDPASARSAIASVLELAGTASMAACALMVIRRRASGPLTGSIGDAVVVGLGAWLLSWVLFIAPRLSTDGGRVTDVLSGLYVPSSAVLLFFVALMLFSHVGKPTSLVMLVVATLCAVIGNIIYALIEIDRIDVAGERVAFGLYASGYFIAGAAFLHPSISTAAQGPTTTEQQTGNSRMALTTLSLMAPLAVLASTEPVDALDRGVRAVSAVALAGAVTIRVIISGRANQRAHQQLLRGAQTDPLTGLPNRSLLLERIGASLAASWNSDATPTLFFVDLDRFKNINDSLGHAAGDEVLKLVARRLVHAAPDGATVARLSGDEYVVLDPASRSSGASLALAERLLSIFKEPLAISQGDVFVSASIGVASANSASANAATDLLRHADTAMYRAKDAGRNCMALYDESMHERVAHRLAVETALYRALDRRELRLYHQPILDLDSGDVIGFEALMRWQRPDGSLVSPAEFIPIAEDTGTIVPIGSWALLEALTQLRSWIDDGVCSNNATMSVNVSPRQLSDPNFPAIVGEAITRSGVPPQLLWLEVTESVMISEPELALATLRRLRSLGVRMALDDFGTGYSSLSLLQKFPLQRLKIDRAFVHGVADNANDRSLVRTIVAMGQTLGLDMVAEGVESIHQLQVLSDLGCSKAQGYLISHPVPPEAMRSTVAALERLGQFPGLKLSGRTTAR